MFVSGGLPAKESVLLFASQGEGRLREGDEFRQFPQILGGGSQQELVLSPVRRRDAINRP